MSTHPRKSSTKKLTNDEELSHKLEEINRKIKKIREQKEKLRQDELTSMKGINYVKLPPPMKTNNLPKRNILHHSKLDFVCKYLVSS